MSFITTAVLTPMILTMTSSPVLLQVGDAVNLTCMALGGPRLTLAWRRDGMDIVNGMTGDGTITHMIMSASNNDLGNYTCRAAIDSEQMELDVFVVVGKIFSIALLSCANVLISSLLAEASLLLFSLSSCST